jgi:hypothetical protein
MLGSFLGAVGCEVVITSFVMVEQEITKHASQRGEPALRRGIGARGVGHA